MSEEVKSRSGFTVIESGIGDKVGVTLAYIR